MSQPRKIYVPGLLITLLAACPGNAQAPTNNDARQQIVAPLIKVETRLVLVDVVVTSHKGEIISGLHQEDFRIEEDGKPQAISEFEEHKRDTSAPVNLPTLPINVYTNRQSVNPSDSVNVLLIDMLNTYPWSQKDVCNQSVKFLKTVPPGTHLAIFTLNAEQLRLVRGFTTDFSGLSAALGQKSGVVPEASWLNPTPSRQAAELQGLSNMIMMQASPVAIEAVKQYLGQETATRIGTRSDLTLQAFQHLARYLSGIRARKNVIWFADSFPITFVPENKVHTPNHQANVQQTSDMLTAAQVAIYPVSARGLIGDPTFEVSDMLGNTRDNMFGELNAAQIAAETIAHDTGGRAFYNTNGLEAAMAKAIDEGSHYYTLAYTPTNRESDGNYRKIQVKLAEGEYKLSFRRGYYADKPDSSQTAQGAAEDPLISLVGFGMPNFDQITYQIHAAPLQQQPPPDARRAGLNSEIAGPIVRFGVDLKVSLQNFALETAADGTKRGRLETMLVAYNREGKILNIAKLASRFALPSKDYAELQTSGLPLYLEIDVPPGDVYLRTGVYDLSSGKAGTLGFPLARE